MNLTTLYTYINSLSKYRQYDSGILYDSGNDIKKILLSLDYDIALYDYAKLNNYDAILIHHSIGCFYYTAYKGLKNKLIYIQELGLYKEVYNNIINEDSFTCFMQMRNSNMIGMLPTFYTEDKDLSCIVTHHIPDYLLYKRIFSIAKGTNSLVKLRDNLCDMVSEICSFPTEEAVVLYTKLQQYSSPFIDLCFVSSASCKLQKQLMEDGVDLLIVTSTTNDAIDYALNNNKAILLLNHIPFDLVGMKLLKRKIEEKFPLTVTLYEK